MKGRRAERPHAGRYYLARRSSAGRPRPSAPDVVLARRAVRLLQRVDPLPDGHEYSPTDLILPTRAQPGIVYIQQRYLGLPVYDGRRAVVLRVRGPSRITGRSLVARGLSSLTPASSPADALRRAATLVFRSCPRGALEQRAGSPSVERFTAFNWGDVTEPVAHLAVYVAGRARLAWVVELGSRGGRRYELVLDAETLRLLKRRIISHAVAARLTFANVAHTITFDASWGPNAWRRLVCQYEDEKVKLPASVGGVMTAGPPPDGLPDAWSLAALTLASAAFELLVQAGARLPRTGDVPSAKLYGRPESDAGRAAQAFADHVELSALDLGGGAFTHAAEDPTVVLHETSHVVLSFNVGGSTLTSPFESFGESGGVSEGLADLLGLTLWNRIARDANPAHADDWSMGRLLLPSPRDYTRYWSATPPTAPAGDGGIHARGIALCGGLLAALHAFSTMQQRRAAEDALWRALFVALQQAPHQGPLPLFCCVTTRVIAALSASLATDADTAFRAVGLPLTCPHADAVH